MAADRARVSRFVASAWRVPRLWCVVVSPAVLGGAVLAIGGITPGYRPMADTVSRLGSPGEPYAALVGVVFVAYGLLILVGAGPLGRWAPTRERLLSVAIGGYALAAVMAGVAPKDAPHTAHTVASQVHVAATVVGGALILLAMVLVAWRGPTPADRRAAVVVAVLTLVGVAIYPFLWGSSVYGLVERSFLAISALWLAWLAARSLTAGTSG